jgi:hypothetical protein
MINMSEELVQMEQIKYSKIHRHGTKYTRNILGNKITIQEKIDGSNMSFRVDKYGNLRVFSRNRELEESNNLSGAYEWAHVNIDPEQLNPHHIYYGEWTAPHKIKYLDKYHHSFYLFDVYNHQHDSYEPLNTIKLEAMSLGVPLTPILYDGPFLSDEHIESHVGMSGLTESGLGGEGIVVKSYDAVDSHGKQPFVKYVSDYFKEVKHKKTTDKKKSGSVDEVVEACITEARVEKQIHKMVESGVIGSDYDITDMGAILKNMGSSIYDDIIEEELHMILQAIRRKVGKQTPNVVKGIVEKNNEE